MQINLPSDAEALARQKAASAGFGDDISAYVAHLITVDEAGAENGLDPQASEEILRRGEADLAAGRTYDMHAALLAMGKKKGFRPDP